VSDNPRQSKIYEGLPILSVPRIPDIIKNGKLYKFASLDCSWGRMELTYLAEDGSYDAETWHKNRSFGAQRYVTEENCKGCPLYKKGEPCNCNFLVKARKYQEEQRILDERMMKLMYKDYDSSPNKQKTKEEKE